MTIQVIPIFVQQEIEEGDELESVIRKSKAGIRDGDVVVVSQKAISKTEGKKIRLDAVLPSRLAAGIAGEYEKDPRLVEVILSESSKILRISEGVIITETKNGAICANAGVDESNVSGGYVTMLPADPDSSAERLRDTIKEKTKKRVAVIISDTFGRPFRMGQTDCAIGVSGLDPILDYTGKKDAFGRELRVTATAVADELCAAADLARTKSSKVPIVIIRGYEFTPAQGAIKDVLRPEDRDLFR